MGNGPSSAKPREAPGRVRNAPRTRLITYVILIYIIFRAARERVSDIGSRINALPPFSAFSAQQLCKNLTELREHCWNTLTVISLFYNVFDGSNML